MTALIAHDAFQLVGHVHDLAGFLAPVHEILEVGAFAHGFLERHAHFKRNQLGELVRQGIGFSLSASHVAHDGFGCHGAEGHDLADRIAAVELRDVFDNPVAPLHAEVHIEVRQRHPLRVQEAFEQQVVVDRVEVRDLERIGHQRTRTGTPPRTDRDTVVPRPGYELHDDQKVAREPHVANDAQFVVQPLLVCLLLHGIGAGRSNLGKPLPQPGPRPVCQELFQSSARRHRVGRQIGLPGVRPHRTALGDFHRVVEGFRQVGEKSHHLIAGLEVLMVAVAALAPRIVQCPPLLNANPGLMRLVVLPIQKTNLVGGDHRQTRIAGKLQRGAQVSLLIGPSGALQLDVEPLRETTRPPLGGAARSGCITAQQRKSDLPAPRTGERNQSFGVVRNPAPVRPSPDGDGR